MRIFILILLVGGFNSLSAQEADSTLIQLAQVPENFTRKMESRIEKVESEIVGKSEKYLRKFQKQEKELRRKLESVDSLTATEMFHDIDEKYNELKNKLRGSTPELKKLNNNYIPLLDSIETSLNFLNISGTSEILKSKEATQVKDAIESINSVRSKLGQAEDIRKFVQERKGLLLEKFSELGMVKELRKYQKEFFYYQATIKNLKESLNDPDRMVSTALTILQKIPAFQKFFAKNSQLASLFALPGSYNSASSATLNGMQTRSQTQALLQQRFGSGANISQSINSSIQQGQAQLAQLQGRLNLPGAGAELEMPNFKPNMEKAKTFRKRLEVGANMQSVRTNGFFPATSDFCFFIGYKLNDKATTGIGLSYKIGWGEDIRNIDITHQGVGIRTFIDYQIKESFFITGGAEMNYRSQIREFNQLDDITAWQKSALIGITKKYSVAKKVNGNIQLLFDLLYNQQVPKTKFFLFRLGYNLK